MSMVVILLVLLGLVVIAIFAYFLGKRSNQTEDIVVTVKVDTSANALPNFSRADDEGGWDGDSWEGGFWEASDPKRLRARVELEYRDGNNTVSKRIVRIREFDNILYGGMLMGHCELRDATRTFRFDRIKQCVDVETGEIVKNVRDFLNELYAKSPERSTEILAEDYVDVLKTLYFVAKADGQYRQDEKTIIAAYLRRLIRDERITPEMIDHVLEEIGVPSMQGFKMAFGRVLKSGQVDLHLLGACCKEIVDSQKSVHPMEKEALDYIAKKVETAYPSNSVAP